MFGLLENCYKKGNRYSKMDWQIALRRLVLAVLWEGVIHWVTWFCLN